MPGWNTIRKAGEYRLLNQAANLACVLVPVVAAVWPAIRNVLGTYGARYDDLPLSLALGFFAALLLIAGRAVYLLRAPHVLRDFQREEYVFKLLQDYKAEPSSLYLASIARSIENAHGHMGRPLPPPAEGADAHETIRAYAEYHYDTASRSDPTGRAVATALYLGAALLLGVVALRQILVVAGEAGFLRAFGAAL